ncbi:MAG: response regulator [Pseudomonadota bacterium]
MVKKGMEGNDKEVKKIKILIVDDSVTWRTLLARLLSQEPDIEVVGQAIDGHQAIEMTKRLLPDLILMDVVMPDMDGLETTRRIMIHHPTPIIILSAYSNSPEMNIVFNALTAGALDIISKGRESEDEEYKIMQEELVSKIRVLSRVKVQAGK